MLLASRSASMLGPSNRGVGASVAGLAAPARTFAAPGCGGGLSLSRWPLATREAPEEAPDLFCGLYVSVSGAKLLLPLRAASLAGAATEHGGRHLHSSFGPVSDRNGVLFGSCSRMVGSIWPHHTGSPPARRRQRCPQSLKLYVSTTSLARRSTPSSNLQTGQRISPLHDTAVVRNRTAAHHRPGATNAHVNSAATTIRAIVTQLGDGIRLGLAIGEPAMVHALSLEQTTDTATIVERTNCRWIFPVSRIASDARPVRCR